MIRKHLSADGLFPLVRKEFESFVDERQKASIKYSIQDMLMSGLAVFTLKAPSLLKFQEIFENFESNNIKRLFNLSEIPSDTQLRDVLDPVDPSSFRKVYDSVLREMQRGKELEKFMFLEHYAIALDGTDYFSSTNTNCPCCLTKKNKSSESGFTFHHQMLGACIVHPNHKQVIPLFPEAIINGDGDKKNDCERNASNRWIESFRSNHPKMPVIILEDSLASNVPHLKLLKDNNCRYLTGAKRSDHVALFEQYETNSKLGLTTKHQEVSYVGNKVIKKVTKSYEFIHSLDLNKSHDFKTNMILFTEKIETLGKAKEVIATQELSFSWVTDLELTLNNITDVVLLARRRWAIENETFQTLKKTTEYNFEHNYGHGSKYLSVNFAMLCILAFLIDQVLEFCCDQFKEVIEKASIAKKYVWERMRSALDWVEIESWCHLYSILLKSKKNTS